MAMQRFFLSFSPLFCLWCLRGVKSLDEVANLEEVRGKILGMLTALRDGPQKMDTPRIYHLDVGAMWEDCFLLFLLCWTVIKVSQHYLDESSSTKRDCGWADVCWLRLQQATESVPAQTALDMEGGVVSSHFGWARASSHAARIRKVSKPIQQGKDGYLLSASRRYSAGFSFALSCGI